MAVIQFKGASITNGDLTVIEQFDFELNQGQWVYLTGKVGSGKTSIVRTMIGEIPLEKGSATVCGYDLASIKKRRIPDLRRKLGIIFQDFQLLMDRSVEDNLLFALECTGWNDRKAASRRIGEVLEAVGMTSKAHRMPHQLSGGEQQRIAIARALLNDPPVILADEPTGNLDVGTAVGIMNLLREINGRGTAIIMVTHNMNLVRDYPGRVFVCRDNLCREESFEGSLF